MAATGLPEPVCVSGYTSVQVLLILGAQGRVAEMHDWMRGRGIHLAACVCGEAGRGPHGSVVPQAAVRRFLEPGVR